MDINMYDKFNTIIDDLSPVPDSMEWLWIWSVIRFIVEHISKQDELYSGYKMVEGWDLQTIWNALVNDPQTIINVVTDDFIIIDWLMEHDFVDTTEVLNG